MSRLKQAAQIISNWFVHGGGNPTDVARAILALSSDDAEVEAALNTHIRTGQWSFGEPIKAGDMYVLVQAVTVLARANRRERKHIVTDPITRERHDALMAHEYVNRLQARVAELEAALKASEREAASHFTAYQSKCGELMDTEADLDAALARLQATRCPIGLDDNPRICSAGCCFHCAGERVAAANARAERAEAALKADLDTRLMAADAYLHQEIAVLKDRNARLTADRDEANARAERAEAACR